MFEQAAEIRDAEAIAIKTSSGGDEGAAEGTGEGDSGTGLCSKGSVCVAEGEAERTQTQARRSLCQTLHRLSFGKEPW